PLFGAAAAQQHQQHQQQALRALLESMRTAAPECNAHDVANGMWALARLRLLAPPVAPSGTAAPQPPSSTSENATEGGDAVEGTSGPPQPALRDWGLEDPGPRKTVRRQSQPVPEVVAAATAGPAATAESDMTSRTPAGLLHADLQAAGSVLLHVSCRRLLQYNPQQLANTAWAAAVLELQPPPSWVAAFWPAALAALPYMRTEELVATATASTRIGLQPSGEWLAAVLDLTAEAMRQAAGPEERNQAGKESSNPALGQAGYPFADSATAKWSNDGAPKRLRIQATGRCLASLLWCVAAWRVRVPAAWTAAVLARLEALAVQEGSLEPASLATALQAMARIGLRPDALVAGWTRRVVEGHVAAATGAASGSGCGVRRQRMRTTDASLAAATAVVSWESDADRDALAREGEWNAMDCGSKGGVWSGDEEGFLSYRQRLGRYDGRAARMLLWSLARLGCPLGDRTAGVLALAAADCCDTTTTTSVSTSHPPDPGAAPASEPATRSGAAGATGRHESSSSSSSGGGGGGLSNVCLALWALARVAQRPEESVMRQLVRQVYRDIPLAAGVDLVTVVRALAVLRYCPGPRFWRAVERRVACLAPGLTEQQASVLKSCCAQLGWQFSAKTLEALDHLDVGRRER
ncbi:hypothetical protein Agub_g10180, partial [Astrephomene gubernaculifera]